MYDKTNLKKRGNIWYCIKAVPPSLVSIIGKKELIKTLRTGDLREANTRKLAVLANFQKQIETARAKKVVLDSSYAPDQHDEFTKALIKVAQSAHFDNKTSRPRIKEELQMFVDNHVNKHGLDNPEIEPPEKLLEGIDTARKVIDGGHLISETITLYLLDEKGTITEQTLQEKKSHLKKFQDYMVNDIVVENISRTKVRDYLNNEVMPSPTNPKTKAKIFNNVKQWLNWCSDRGYIEQSPALGLKVSSKKHKVTKDVDESRKAWTNDEIKHLLIEVSQDKKHNQNKLDLQKIIKIGMYSGMRLGEICEMKVSDLNDDCFYIQEGKTESARRMIPIHSEIKTFVQDLVDNSNDGYLIEGLQRRGADNKRMWNIQKKFGRFKTKLGYGKDKVFHSFRKAFITKLQRAGVTDHTVKQIVGHANQDITFGVYSDGLEVEQLREAVERVRYDA